MNTDDTNIRFSKNVNKKSTAESNEVEIAGPDYFKGAQRAHSPITMGEEEPVPDTDTHDTLPPSQNLSLPIKSTISSILTLDNDLFEDAPDLSGEPVMTKDHMERTMIFDRDEDRWSQSDHYELPKEGEKVENYLIIHELGRGGFGAVYRAKNLTLGRDEALKLILPSTKDECTDIEKRFEREIDIVSRLEHPNIVRLYSSGHIKHKILWMTMELIDGKRLDERLEEFGPFKFEHAKNLMLQMLCGLMEAHRRQIVHRDIKPANIMLSKKEGYIDQAVILDFGLSKALGSEENTEVQELTCVDEKRIYGTPQYMAPEQINSGKLGPWTDVYAAGLILFELITGQPAVPGDSLFDIAYKQSYEPIIYPKYLENTALKVVIEKACAKNPADRYNHAGEFFDALQHINDINDPVSVLSYAHRDGMSLNSIGMRENNDADLPTQIGIAAIDSVQLEAISRDGSPKPAEPANIAAHNPVKTHPILLATLILAAIIIICMIVGIVMWANGSLEIHYVSGVQTLTPPAP